MKVNRAPSKPLRYVQWLNEENDWLEPSHLKPIGELFERIAAWARGESDEVIRACISLPIRHGKTETVLGCCVWLLEQVPSLNIMLLAYNADRANELGNRLRQLCRVFGVPKDIGPAKGWDRMDRWKNEHGGGVVILSPQQSREGFTVHVLICDDPIDEQQVQKQDERDACDKAIVFYTGRTKMMRKGGNKSGPVIIVASRFSRDDMIGRRMLRPGWEIFHEPAIRIVDGKKVAFAPEFFDLAQLESTRAELAVTDPREETWFSRWQGTPKEDRGADKFKPGPATYELLPPGKNATGVYLIGERQWFAIVHLRISKGCAFVRSCQRFVAEPNELASRLKEIPDRGEVYAFISVHERIAIRRMLERGVTVTPLTEGQNRLWRSLRTIQLWEENRILWPADGSGKANIARISKFTGSEDEDPDEVDALVAVIEGAMLWANADRPEKFGKRRYE